jgi:hypothetical protein
VKIEPSTKTGARWSATLKGLTADEIRNAIGFPSNVDEDETKGYGASWSFTADGVHCQVWYRTTFRAGGPRKTLEAVFGANHVEWHG